MPPDVVYPVRPGESNDELRYSLRSLSNLPHGRVWIVGHKPLWVTNVEYLPGNRSGWPRANLYHNLTLITRCNDVSDQIVVMNDDIYITQPLTEAPILYRGPLSEQYRTVVKKAGRRGWWQESLAVTEKVLTVYGRPDPLSYELHTPFPCDRRAMAETLRLFSDVQCHNPPQWRTLHGNVHRIGGQLGVDCKELAPAPVHTPFHSTDDLSWKYFRPAFMRMFPEPSQYEIPQVDARSLVNLSPEHRKARRARA